jgi:hypothetical protein
MKNPISQTIAGLVLQTSNVITGLQTHGGALTLSTATAAGLAADLALLKAAQNGCNAAKAELAMRRLTVNNLLKGARRFVTVAREVLKMHLGSTHSAVWIEPGFIHGLRIPSRVDELIQILNALAAYFAVHPDHENAQMGVVGATYTSMAGDLAAAHGAVNTQKTVVQNAMDARDEKADAIRATIRKLIKELSIHLDPMDNRYLSFGLNRPGQLATPDVPQNVVVTLVGENAVSLRCAKAPRAQHYRLWKKVVGVDEDFIAVGSSADVDFAINNLPANATVEIAISAVNNGGESARSAVVTVKTLG